MKHSSKFKSSGGCSRAVIPKDTNNDTGNINTNDESTELHQEAPHISAPTRRMGRTSQAVPSHSTSAALSEPQQKGIVAAGTGTSQSRAHGRGSLPQNSRSDRVRSTGQSRRRPAATITFAQWLAEQLEATGSTNRTASDNRNDHRQDTFNRVPAVRPRKRTPSPSLTRKRNELQLHDQNSNKQQKHVRKSHRADQNRRRCLSSSSTARPTDLDLTQLEKQLERSRRRLKKELEELQQQIRPQLQHNQQKRKHSDSHRSNESAGKFQLASYNHSWSTSIGPGRYPPGRPRSPRSSSHSYCSSGEKDLCRSKSTNTSHRSKSKIIARSSQVSNVNTREKHSSESYFYKPQSRERFGSTYRSRSSRHNQSGSGDARQESHHRPLSTPSSRHTRHKRVHDIVFPGRSDVDKMSFKCKDFKEVRTHVEPLRSSHRRAKTRVEHSISPRIRDRRHRTHGITRKRESRHHRRQEIRTHVPSADHPYRVPRSKLRNHGRLDHQPSGRTNRHRDHHRMKLVHGAGHTKRRNQNRSRANTAGESSVRLGNSITDAMIQVEADTRADVKLTQGQSHQGDEDGQAIDHPSCSYDEGHSRQNLPEAEGIVADNVDGAEDEDNIEENDDSGSGNGDWEGEEDGEDWLDDNEHNDEQTEQDPETDADWDEQDDEGEEDNDDWQEEEGSGSIHSDDGDASAEEDDVSAGEPEWNDHENWGSGQDELSDDEDADSANEEGEDEVWQDDEIFHLLGDGEEEIHTDEDDSVSYVEEEPYLGDDGDSGEDWGNNDPNSWIDNEEDVDDNQVHVEEDTDNNTVVIQLPDNDVHCRVTPPGVPDGQLSHQELEHNLKDEQEKRLCVVCRDRPKNVLVLPCRHLCLCVSCTRSIATANNAARRVCPLCRTQMETVMDIYL